ncbi:DUF6809 family protein [Paenibacillaceae bacterium WGS1546]|uniref:DUF6809 family protein n=1 Tax=Cohnella sp. WGS1546 TaxID=3366810 RepID=UPI00372D5F34
MNSVLQALYNGDLCPVGEIVPKKPAYREIGRKITEELGVWRKRLTEDEYNQLESLLDLRVQTIEMDLAASFEYGFKLGASLMIEVMSEQ